MRNNMANLGRVSDGELERQYNGLKKLMRGSKFSTGKRRDLETEACYLQREMMIRTARKEAHEKYLETQSQKRRSNRR